MKISSPWKKSPGFALLALLCCLVVILITFAGVMFWVSTNGEQMRKNLTFTSSEAAAEGVTEYIYAHMDRDFVYQNLNAGGASYYAGLTPSTTGWPVQYTFSNSVTWGTQGTNLNYLGSEYTNLLGFPQTNIITVTATPSGQTFNVPATVSQTFVFASIPAFQFAIFYNINLEMDPSATMPIAGAVFSNAGIWAGTPNLIFSNTVEAAGQVSTNSVDPFVSNNSKTDSGTPQANFVYAGSPPQPESGVNPLVIPIGASSTGTNDNSTNVEAIINIPPASVAAPQSIAYVPTNQVYDFNAASLIISNWYWASNGVAPWSNNFTVILQDSVTSPSLQSNGVAMNWIMLTNDYYIFSNRYGSSAGAYKLLPTNYVPGFRFTNNMSSIRWTNNPTGTNTVWYAGFSFLSDVTFYDYRESDFAQAIQFDVAKFIIWLGTNYANGGYNWNADLNADMGHGINSAFIYNAVPLNNQQLPAVRVANGMLLPSSGLTLATPQPMYVLGSYNVSANGHAALLGSHNTANTYPAAFLADAITILSSNWNDTLYTSSYSESSRTPCPTTINAACLEGIVPSTSSAYCGGVENFLRLLEAWSGSTTPLTYNGSIMVMFPSQYATNQWGGSYYGVPERDWSFDTNFLIQAELPPLTPQFKAVIRNSWSGY
jgi:hypothetical protein